jgi:hypothetical protein
MTVTVDIQGIARTTAALGGDGTVILRLRAELAPDEETMEASLLPGDEPANGGWFAGPDTWLLLVEGLPNEVNAFAGILAERLSAMGVAGVLTGAGAVGNPAWARRLDEGLSLYLLIGFRPSPGSGPYDGWTPGREALATAVESAMAWITAGDAKVMASVDHRANFWVDAPTAARLMVADVLRSGGAGASGYDEGARTVRHGFLTAPAGLDLTVTTDQLSWQEVVGDARAALLAQSLTSVTVAMVTDNMWGTLLRGALPGEGPVHGHAYDWHPETWHEFTLDPCGIQLLTDKHLAKAHDLSAWSITRLDATHHLVEASDLEPWYGTLSSRQPVAADVLDQARRDFGEMIMTPARAESLGYATKPPRRMT